MNRERETFLMSDIQNENIWDLFGGSDVYSDEECENIEYEWLDDTQEYLDLGKGYQNLLLVFKRCSDNKCFEINYTMSSDGVYEELSQLEATEVFPKQIEITIYE